MKINILWQLKFLLKCPTFLGQVVFTTWHVGSCCIKIAFLLHVFSQKVFLNSKMLSWKKGHTKFAEANNAAAENRNQKASALSEHWLTFNSATGLPCLTFPFGDVKLIEATACLKVHCKSSDVELMLSIFVAPKVMQFSWWHQAMSNKFSSVCMPSKPWVFASVFLIRCIQVWMFRACLQHTKGSSGWKTNDAYMIEWQSKALIKHSWDDYSNSGCGNRNLNTALHFQQNCSVVWV